MRLHPARFSKFAILAFFMSWMANSEAYALDNRYEGENNYYSYEACDFALDLVRHIDKYVTKSEWHDLKQHKFSKSFEIAELPPTPSETLAKDIKLHVVAKAYLYISNGLQITYETGDYKPLGIIIKTASFDANRLPKDMRDREFFLNTLNIRKFTHAQKSKVLNIGCDGISTLLTFKDDDLVNMIIEQDLTE